MEKKIYIKPDTTMIDIDNENLLASWSKGSTGNGSGSTFTSDENIGIDEGNGTDSGYDYGDIDID